MGANEQRRDKDLVKHFQQALGPFVVAVEATRMPMVFTSADTDHRIIFANDSFLKLTGFRRSEVIDKPFARLLTGAENPDTLKLIESEFQGSAEPLNVECLRKDGGRVSASLLVVPVHDRQGAVVQYVASFVDLTVHNKWRRREKSALRKLFQQTPDFIATTEGPDHRITFANAAYQQLVGDRDLVGRTMREALPELATQEILAQRDQVYRTGKAFLARWTPVKLQREPGADVETRYLDLIYQPITAPDGTVTGIFCEGHDVTEQKILDDRVKALQVDLIHMTRLSAMGTMAATLAHEMTQPLTAIANNVAACSRLNAMEGDHRAQIKGLLEAIAAAVRRGGDVIHELQKLTERRKTPRDHFRLKDAIHESVALVRAAGCGNAAIVDRSAEQIELDADRTQIEQVLINLLRNSCEALGPSGGCVTISTTMRQGKVIVSVKDTGEGVSPEAAKTLFQWSDSAKPHGAGIGLSICRTIVEAHGGDLWLKESGHTGSCFAFSLPLAPNGEVQGHA
ncbi:PAS domain-containing protein [Sphingomonas oligophenolica]|uniref:PAS domain-containing protein n=1 Tax=Sphingomonas oligophenolica TaxID=301154 RepID=UPI0031D0F97C